MSKTPKISDIKIVEKDWMPDGKFALVSPNTESDKSIDELLDKIFAWAEDDGDYMMNCRAEAKQELTNLIQTLELKARKEAVDYFYWRIDCNTLISELEGWRGCIDNAKDQTERHFALKSTNKNKE